MSRKKIAPSILSADLTRLAQEVEAAEKGGADWLHVDVMDGHFAPTITIGPLIVSALRKTTKLPLDVHLMIENPDRYIEQFSEAGADIITVPVLCGLLVGVLFALRVRAVRQPLRQLFGRRSQVI